jgi:NAD(P)-dependent dehydrogenase (short-subunit alcohol dehydrogenase family)
MTALLDGKVAIVTGVGLEGTPARMSQAISLAFAREGARLLLVDTEPEGPTSWQERIGELGGGAHAFSADLSDPEEGQTMVDHAMRTFGQIDVLVNNYGYVEYVDIRDESVELYDRTIRTNLTSAFLACKYIAPIMAERQGGSIINISSIAAIREVGVPHAAYSISKAGLLGLTLDLAGAYGRQGVRVNTICPGHIDSQGQDAGSQMTRNDGTLLGIEGIGLDVASAAVFLASADSRYLTGLTLPVDGGASSSIPLAYKVRYA